MALPRIPQKRSQQCGRCLRTIANGNLARHRRKCAQITSPSSVSQWLGRHHIDLVNTGALGPKEKLDQLTNLREHPPDPHDQCVRWRIFRDERADCLPTLALVAVKLSAGTCGDAWQLDQPKTLSKAELDDWKARLWTGQSQSVRLLNIPATDRLVDRDAQDQYRVMVRDKIHEYYDAGPSHLVEIHSATMNVNPHGTVTQVHHDSNAHISTAYTETNADYDQPAKLWLLWKASENNTLSTCYSDTASAVTSMGPGGYIIQYSGESLLLPANVPHAVISLSTSMLYGHSFTVQDRADDPTSFALEISAGVKPSEAIQIVARCYEGGLKNTDPRIRMIHAKHLCSTMLADRMVMRKLANDAYINRIIDVGRSCSEFRGTCTFCILAGVQRNKDQDCWEEHGLEDLRVPVSQALRLPQGEPTSKKRKNSRE